MDRLTRRLKSPPASAMGAATMALLLLACGVIRTNAQTATATAQTAAAVLEATTPSDWLSLDPENTLYVDLPAGRVVIALAPAFAPNHVAKNYEGRFAACSPGCGVGQPVAPICNHASARS